MLSGIFIIKMLKIYVKYIIVNENKSIITVAISGNFKK